jgi:hypothetical protein
MNYEEFRAQIAATVAAADTLGQVSHAEQMAACLQIAAFVATGKRLSEDSFVGLARKAWQGAENTWLLKDAQKVIETQEKVEEQMVLGELTDDDLCKHGTFGTCIECLQENL